jgi:DNA invertase Pin-like site-specific DNA recombinase
MKVSCKPYIAYYRVSTKRQGESGLGLEAQQEAVRKFIVGAELIAEHQEVESGGRADRPALEAALRDCRIHRATLVIAKLDRLARSVAFISRLQEAGVDFVAVDLPHANTFTVQIMAAVAEHERRLIAERTKAALQAAKARGVQLGGRRAGHRIEDHAAKGRERSALVRAQQADAVAKDRLEVIDAIRASGSTSLRAIARTLNDRSVPAPRGGQWSAGQVKRIVERRVSA